MRWFGISLVVISLIVLAGWYNSERLANRIVSGQLSALGFELRVLKLSPPTASGLKIASFEVRSKSMIVEIDQLDLTQLLEGEFHLEANRIFVALNAADEDEPQTLEALWTEVQDLLPVLPRSGQIKELRVCQEGQCESMALGWQRNIGQFDMHLTVPAQHFMAELRYTDRWQLDWLLDKKLALGSIVIEPRDDFFSLVGQGHSAQALQLEGLGLDGVQGKLNGVAFSLDALVSQQATMVTLLDSLVVNAKVSLAADWSLSTEAGRAYSTGQHEIGFSYGSETVTVSIIDHPLINMESLEFDSAGFQIEGANECRLELSLAELEITDLQCDLAKVAISASLDDYAAHVSVSELEIRQNNEFYNSRGRSNIRGLIGGSKALSGEAIFSVEGNIVNVEFAESTEVWGSAIELIVRHNMLDGVGDFNAGVTGKLRNLLAPAGKFADAEVVSLLGNTSGQFFLRSNGRWGFPVGTDEEPHLQHQTVVSLSQFSIEYDGYAAEGGKLDATLAGWPMISGDVTIGVPSISAGIDVQSLDLDFTVYVEPISDIATLRGTEFRMALLGGSVSSQQFDYDFATGNGAALLSLDKLELSEILAMQRQDFTCSGLVSGSVPVQISAGNLTVDGASIAAEAPGGFVRYLADQSVTTLGQQNEGLAVVLDAMTNFQYHTLAASVDYSEDGLMTARTSIKGANPQYQDGREVHLNLSVEENVRTLLESLRLGADLAEKIGEKTSIRP